MDDYKKEIERATQARNEGNEGMARVCARRAAGIVIGEYLHRRGYFDINKNTFDRLTIFCQLPYVDQSCKDISQHFLIKVNQEHNLPMNIDLIREVIWLKDKLLSESID